ncbi:MAG: hypothetical protein WBN83_00610 [Desulfoprunum sp.]|jgi:hypothetical protein|uniref:hypothetical protein n=1 Tax=Desulfoprunum sp. TaxID=2020866 RepID=UPI000A4F45F6
MESTTRDNCAYRQLPEHPWLLVTLMIALCCFFSLVLTGCSGNGEQAAEGGRIRACGLVTQAEMETIFGRSLQIPEEKINGESAICTYVSAEGTDGAVKEAMVSVSLLVRSHGDAGAADAYERYVTGLKESAGLEMTEVQGIGGKACWNEDVRQLTVFTDRYMLLLSAGPGKQGTLEISRRIIDTALPRLPK